MTGDGFALDTVYGCSTALAMRSHSTCGGRLFAGLLIAIRLATRSTGAWLTGGTVAPA